jgi:enoyl-CoA hydratase
MATWQSGMLQAPDVQEAMQAKTQKRAPIYDNLLP